MKLRTIAPLIAASLLLDAGCATRPPRARTPSEARAYQAYEKCWNAGGPPTLDFTAVEEAGRVYAVMSHSFGSGVGQAKYDAVKSCMAAQGVTPTWDEFPPSMMGGRGRR